MFSSILDTVEERISRMENRPEKHIQTEFIETHTKKENMKKYLRVICNTVKCPNTHVIGFHKSIQKEWNKNSF